MLFLRFCFSASPFEKIQHNMDHGCCVVLLRSINNIIIIITQSLKKVLHIIIFIIKIIMPESQSGITKNNTVRRASTIAKSTKEKSKAKNVTDFVQISRATIQFSIAGLQAQLDLLNELSKLSEEDKLTTAFQLLDKDKDDKLDVAELADGLRKIRGDAAFEESIALAITRIAMFDDRRHSKLNIHEFKIFVHVLSEVLGCKVHELCELFVLTIVYSDSSGNTNIPTENQVTKSTLTSSETEEEVKEIEEEAIDVAAMAASIGMVEERVKILFDLFDGDRDGLVEFAELVAGLFQITSDLEGSSKAATMALLLFDKNEAKTLNFKQFTKFLVAVSATMSDAISFDDIANSITMSAIKDEGLSKEEIGELFSLETSMKYVTKLNIGTQEEVEKVSPAEMGRLDRLFDMWDRDGDGKLDFEELALGLRKFEESTTLETTVDETASIMSTFDISHDGGLNREEFAVFVIKFATLLRSDLNDMIDFMIVTTALKENTEAEKKYMNAVGSGQVYHCLC
jgi:Ca2+-binding EF-hand superfamily protein